MVGDWVRAAARVIRRLVGPLTSAPLPLFHSSARVRLCVWVWVWVWVGAETCGMGGVLAPQPPG